MKIDFVKTLEASSPYTPGRIYFEESTSLIKVATASNQYRVFGGVRSADYDASTDILTILNGNGDEVYIDFSQYVNQDEYEDDQYVISVALTELNNSISSISDNVDYLDSQVSDVKYSMQELQNSIPVEIIDVGTISFNSNNQAALPAGTYTEVLNAYNNGKSIIIRGSSGDVTYDYVLEMWSTGNNLYFINIYGNNRCILMSNDTLWIFNSIFPNETDPIFSASPAAGITSTNITNWNNKVSNVQADWNATSGLAAILNKPVIPGDASVAAWGYLKANDVSTKVDNTDAIKSLSLGMNSSTYTITLSGAMADGSTFTVGDPIDLPLETMVVDGSYNSSTKKVSLGLKNGSSVEFSVADLVAGLQTEITSSNKLSADLIQDGTTNKVVTATDKNNWNSLVSNVQADWNATTGLGVILNKPTIPAAVTESTVSGWGFTKNTGTLTGISFNGTTASVSNGVASITANVLPDIGSSDNGKLLYAFYGNENNKGWIKSDFFFSSGMLQTPFNGGFYTTGSLGSMYLNSAGIQKYDYSDWSWISTTWVENNGTHGMTLQDYLDKHCLPEAGSGYSGKFITCKYDSSDGYYWGIDDDLYYSSSVLRLRTVSGSAASAGFEVEGTASRINITSDQFIKWFYPRNQEIKDWSWIKYIYYVNNVGSTVTLQECVNRRAADSGEGLFAMVRKDSSNNLYWDDSYQILRYSNNTLYAGGDNNYLTTTGTYGSTIMSTNGITKMSFSDWSWLRIEWYTTATGTSSITLQDYLDKISLPEPQSNNIGAVPSVNYIAGTNFTPAQYFWGESGFVINYSTNIMEAPLFGGYSAANTSTTYKLDGTGLNSSSSSNWSWISRLSGNNKVTLQDTLDTKAPLASPALTGTPTAPTAATTTNNTQIATTAFVKSVLPTVNNATLTIQKNGTNVNTFTANSSSNVTANIQVNELPTVTSSDNGKILKVVSGAWAAASPVTVYSGSNTPNNSTGIDGDIYIQS